MIDRRKFLILSTGVLAAAAGGVAAPFLWKKRRTKYFISTPPEILGPQDLNLIGLRDAKKISLPGIDGAAEKMSLLTSVNDDGTGLKRYAIPLHYHSITGYPGSGSVFAVGSFGKSCVVELDRESMEVINVASMPSSSENYSFSGHGYPLPGNDLMAFGMNQFEKGKFDHVSIRERKTLKEVGRVSTYGFCVHEVRVTPDEKHLLCGHYGSLLGLRPYEGLSYYGKHGKIIIPPVVYPPNVTLVEVGTGKRAELAFDWRLQQMGHAEADAENNIYLPKQFPLLESSPGVGSHPFFREGIITRKNGHDFPGPKNQFGIALIYDPKHREIIVPVRQRFEILATSTKTQVTASHDYTAALENAGIHWPKLSQVFVCGISFHPDGRHYVVSTVQGILVFERGT
ncbi:MAG: hypothetical protein ACXVCS_16900, partial [Bdellovibrionota bacterium]